MSLNNAIIPFHKLYLDILHENTNWINIITLLHDNHHIITTIYDLLKKEQLEKLDYDMKLSDLINKIKSEKGHLTKIHYIVTVLHHIIYDLASQEEHYLFPLIGQEEMVILKKPIKYYISINKKIVQQNFFHAFILIYSLESLFYKNFYVGVDFEYTHRIIKLAQFNFEHKSDLKSFVMIVSPLDIGDVITKNMIKLVMCNSHLKKILMGADSLDYPYIRDELLQKNDSKITKFTNSMIDVRYLCEYYKSIKGVDINYSKCSIYDAILYFGVINQEKRTQLEIMEDTMPVPVDRDWTINKLSISQEKYVQYDVLFLKYYYFRMIYIATMDEETDAGKKKIIDLYKHVMYELTQFIYLEKSSITLLTVKCKEEVDIMNNFMVRQPKQIYKMQDIFKDVSVNIITDLPYVDIDKLNNVKMFSTTIMILIKKMVYTIISQKYPIYKSKMNKWTDKLDNGYLFDFFEEMKYSYLKRMFVQIEKILRYRIEKLLLN